MKADEKNDEGQAQTLGPAPSAISSDPAAATTRRRSFVKAAPADETPVPLAAREQVAVFVCHGMGQQVPFETIDAVARLLRKQIRREAELAKPELDSDQPQISTRIVEADGMKLGRAEISYIAPDGKRMVDVHIYEAYWAPLTAGKVGIVDVYTFLKDAGLSGLREARERFDRFMFGSWQSFEVEFVRTFLQFLVVLALFLSLALISTTIIAVGAARTLTQSVGGWPTASLMVDLTCDLLLFGTPAAVLSLLYLLAWRRERARNQRNDELTDHPGRGLLHWCILLLLWLTIAAAIATGALFLLHLTLARNGATQPWWNWGLANFLSSTSVCATVTVAVIWLAVLYINEKIRQFFIEYLGDVAAYIAPHTANKFYEIRQAIQKRARDVAHAIYSMTREGSSAPLYDRVVVMGHSLGSVVAYDTVNALLLDDATKVTGLQVRSRTSHLITFGSPLDKTAFVFREQQPRESQVRESLAANVQPLVRDYANRVGITWINLWSPEDPISGSLEYYDATPPSARPPSAKPVCNERDEYCSVALLAHTMYWQSPLLGRTMLAAVVNM